MQYIILLWLYVNDWLIIDSKKHLRYGKVGIFQWAFPIVEIAVHKKSLIMLTFNGLQKPYNKYSNSFFQIDRKWQKNMKKKTKFVSGHQNVPLIFERRNV